MLLSLKSALFPVFESVVVKYTVCLSAEYVILYPTLFPKTSTAAFPFHTNDEMYAILKEKLDSIKEFYESQIPLYKPDNKEESPK